MAGGSRTMIHPEILSDLDGVVSPARYQEALRQIDMLPVTDWAVKSVKIAVLSSFTFSPIVPFLRVEAARNGIATSIFLGDYNVIDQEIFNVNSRLYAFHPDVLIIAIRLEDYLPQLADGFLDLEYSSGEELSKELLQRLRRLMRHFREQSAASVLLHNFAFPSRASLGILEGMWTDSQRQLIWKTNVSLAELSREMHGVYIFDYFGLVMSEGSQRWQDDKMWYLARIPIAGDKFRKLAQAYMRILRPMFGLTHKCLVLDLDNTLWGGVLGEEGIGGIAIGHSYPGNVYRDFQRYVLDLYRRGVILVLNSKNNLDEVKVVFTTHPDLLLKWEHFSCYRVNWENKAANMVEIAQELGIGLESFVFFDDDPVEREHMRRELPEVLTVEVPTTPLGYIRVLEESGAFESLSHTEEDRQRGNLYRARAESRSFEQQSASLEEFYTALEMEAMIQPADTQTLPRMAQLIAKTNQFNLTTRRHSEAILRTFMDDPNYQVHCLRLKDKFGDNGLVGVAILKRADDSQWWIDTFLLSCRVIGRNVETAFLGFLLKEVERFGGQEVLGEFLPTQKNTPAADFFAKHGADCIIRADDRSVWRLPTKPLAFDIPSYIKITGDTENIDGNQT